jgi:hypothetical protein
MSKLSSTDNWFRKLHHEELHGSRVAKRKIRTLFDMHVCMEVWQLILCLTHS